MPRLVRASLVESNVLRATFDTHPRARNRWADNDALNPGVWRVTPLAPGSGAARVVRVLRDPSDARSVYLILSPGIGLLPDQAYRINVSNSVAFG